MGRLLPLSLLLSAGCGAEPRASNERAVSAALKTLTSAQADFRSNDRDANKVQDFWTGDVAGLYYLKPAGSHEPIKLIEQAVADADPSRPGAKPYCGYWFVAMDVDDTGQPYRQDTEREWPGDRGPGHRNRSKFGICAYPAEWGRTGSAVFFVNEGNTIFKNTKKPGPILKFPPFDEEDDVQPGAPLPPVKLADAQMQRTTVTPVLEAVHAEGRNQVWCVTFQLAWDAMCGHIGAQKPTLVDGPAYVADLNARTTGKDLVKEAWYVAVAGELNQGIGRQVREAMAARFPGVPVPVVIPERGADGDSVAFAYLRRELAFRTPFERYAEEFRFDGRPVHAFGLRAHGPRAAAMSQVLVHTYASKEDFTVELTTSSEEDRLIVVRLPKKATLLETVREAMKRAGAGTAKAMESQDELRVPCFNFDLFTEFPELRDRKFGPGSGIGDTFKKAIQVNQLKLDEHGVKLESYAKLEYSVLNGDYTPPPPPPPKKLICDGPFLFLMAKKGAPLPYFALWVETSELLCLK